MNKNLIILLSAFCLISSSCAKKSSTDNGPGNGNNSNTGNNPPPSTQLKIEVVSGGGQKDTVGNELVNPIVVKVSQSGSPLSGYTIEFEGSGCNQDFPATAITATDGTASYVWHLAGDVGQQTLKAYILDSQNQKVDSASAAATGIAAASGWHNGGCALSTGLNPLLAKLSTGKLFGFFNDIKAYLRYSTDNGASWYAVKNLGNTHNISWILVTPADELYVFVINEGTFYSNDAGQTWKQLSTPPFGAAKITGAIYTSKGNLLVTASSEIDFSSDKGQTWTRTQPSGFDLASPAEDPSGNMYVVDRASGTIYQSKDNGVNWLSFFNDFTERDNSLYIDKNGWFFKTRSDPQYAGLYVSKTGGATYTELINDQNSVLQNFSVQSDGNYYYETLLNTPTGGTGLYRYNTTTGETKLIQTNLTAPIFPYIVAQNGNLVSIGNITQAIYLQK